MLWPSASCGKDAKCCSIKPTVSAAPWGRFNVETRALRCGSSKPSSDDSLSSFKESR